MTLYLDTSLLVAALTHEPDTSRIQGWLGEQDPDELAISGWVTAEFSSALSLKLRTGQIRAAERAEALAMFTRLSAESFMVLPISALQFHTAARFADQHALGVRAGGALHLAICADHGAALCTLDRPLARAGDTLGLQTVLP